MALPGEFGIQFHLPTGRRYAAPDIVRFAAAARESGFGQVWVTDNLGVRNIFVVLSAIAAQVPVRLGAAVVVQYFRNPVDVADAAATLSEIMGGRPFDLGLARGNLLHTPLQVHPTRPVTMLRELAECLRVLLAGEAARFGRYPALAAYFSLRENAEVRLAFRPPGPVAVLGGGNGPRAAAVAGACMDGLIYGPTYVAAARAGKVAALLAAADAAAGQRPRRPPLRKVAEVNVSLSADARAARAYARPIAASVLLHLRRMEYAPADFLRLGVAPEDLAALERARDGGASPDDLAGLVTDAMADGTIIAGDPDGCGARILDTCRRAAAQGFHQVMFSKLGPNFPEAIRLLGDIVGRT